MTNDKAHRGEGGEKYNAQRFLESMLKKHRMTRSNLDEEELSLEWMRLPIKTAQDRRLLVQVASMVLESNSFITRQYRGEKAIWLNVTKTQCVEIELHYRAFQ